MAFDEKTAGEVVRQRLGLSSSIPVIAAIPEALKQMSRKIAANPNRRSLLMTDRDTEITIEPDGTIDIADIPNAIREYLHHGTFWYKNVDDEIYQYPFQILKNSAYANAPLLNGDSYYHYTIEGAKLRTINFTRNLPDVLEGFVLAEVPRFATIADCDLKPELQPLLIEKVIELITGTINDSAEDGEN